MGVELLLLSRRIKNLSQSIRADMSGELIHGTETKTAGITSVVKLNPADIDFFTGKGNIQESMMSLCEKYYLISMTLASADGLVIASSYNNSEEEAAHYSYCYNSGNDPQDSCVNLFGMDFRGENIVGIIKKNDSVQEEWINGIKEDADSILSHWLSD